MKLYSHPGSCSSAIHMTLLESGLEFDVEKVDLFSDRVLGDGRNFNDINPKGSVPVLELDSGETLTEVCAILQYIADQCPDKALAPANGSLERTRLHEWLSYLNSELHMTLGAFFNPALEGPMRKAMEERLDARWKFIDGHLANNDYLLGNDFSVADVYLFIMTNWPGMVGMDISAYKNVGAFASRISERQSAKTVLEMLAH